MMCAMEQDDEITSEQLDDLLDDAPTLDADRPQGQTEVRLTVVVDAETLHELRAVTRQPVPSLRMLRYSA